MDTVMDAASALLSAAGANRLDAAVILGSGWQAACASFGTPEADIAVDTLPGFVGPAVPGHGGRVQIFRLKQRVVAVFVGRNHLYEGLSADQIVHPVRTLAAAGASLVLLTNAAGAVRPDFAVGEPVLICDHLNLTGGTPLTGPTFVDLTNAYSPRLRSLAKHADSTLREGVYAGLRGPQYETPAEIRMLAAMGADLVGMSTVYETIAARALGVEVGAISLVTNLAAGVGGGTIDHAEVLATGAAQAGRIGALLRDIVDLALA